MFSAAYLKDLAERAVSSFAGGALSVVGVDAFSSFEADWPLVASVGLGAAVVSVLKALAARSVGDPESAAFLR